MFPLATPTMLYYVRLLVKSASRWPDIWGYSIATWCVSRDLQIHRQVVPHLEAASGPVHRPRGTYADVSGRRPKLIGIHRRRHQHRLAGLPAGQERGHGHPRFPHFPAGRQRLREPGIPAFGQRAQTHQQGVPQADGRRQHPPRLHVRRQNRSSTVGWSESWLLLPRGG